MVQQLCIVCTSNGISRCNPSKIAWDTFLHFGKRYSRALVDSKSLHLHQKARVSELLGHIGPTTNGIDENCCSKITDFLKCLTETITLTKPF